jgi:hypothetical protein
MSPRRARPTGQSRQQIAHRLRDRRVREETLIVQAADALSRRYAAEAAVAEASDTLTVALEELQHLGFSIGEIAELLEVDPSELGGSGARRPVGRATRPASNAESAAVDNSQI